jgi:hypothetical protein
MTFPGSRLVLPMVVAAGVALGCAGCGGGSPGTPTATAPAASASPSRTPLATAVPRTADAGSLLASVAACLKAHGVPLPAGATAKQVKKAYRTLPLARQQSVLNACGSSLPASARQVIQQDLDKEKKPGLSTGSATP